MRSRRSCHWALTVLVAMAALALAACGGQQPATEQPNPASWFVGEEDRTTPAPPQERVTSLAVGDSAFEPATLVVEAGEAVRVENTGAGTVTFALDGVDVAVVEPGESRVLSIHLQPGQHALSLREDPSVTGTLIVK